MINLNIDFSIKKSINFCLQLFVLFIYVPIYSNSSIIFITSNTVFVNKSEISLCTKHIKSSSINIIYIEKSTITTKLDSIAIVVYNSKEINQKVKVLAKKEKITIKKEYKNHSNFQKPPFENDNLLVINKLNNLIIPSSNLKTNLFIYENYETNSFLFFLQYTSLLNLIYLINFKFNYLKGMFRLRAPPLI